MKLVTLNWQFQQNHATSKVITNKSKRSNSHVNYVLCKFKTSINLSVTLKSLYPKQIWNTLWYAKQINCWKLTVWIWCSRVWVFWCPSHWSPHCRLGARAGSPGSALLEGSIPHHVGEVNLRTWASHPLPARSLSGNHQTTQWKGDSVIYDNWHELLARQSLITSINKITHDLWFNYITRWHW